jgi:hypothetical protein
MNTGRLESFGDGALAVASTPIAGLDWRRR